MHCAQWKYILKKVDMLYLRKGNERIVLEFELGYD